MQKTKAVAVVVFMSLLIGLPHGLQAQANFYQGKTITVVVGTVPGGLYDLWGRLFGRIMGNIFQATRPWWCRICRAVVR